MQAKAQVGPIRTRWALGRACPLPAARALSVLVDMLTWTAATVAAFVIVGGVPFTEGRSPQNVGPRRWPRFLPSRVSSSPLSLSSAFTDEAGPASASRTPATWYLPRAQRRSWPRFSSPQRARGHALARRALRGSAPQKPSVDAYWDRHRGNRSGEGRSRGAAASHARASTPPHPRRPSTHGVPCRPEADATNAGRRASDGSRSQHK